MGAILKLELDIIYPNTKIKGYVDIDSMESSIESIESMVFVVIYLKVFCKTP